MRNSKLLTVVLASYLLLSGCAEMQKHVPFLAAGACTLGIHHAMSGFSSLTRNLASLAGGVMCGVVGRELGKYLEKQDYENIATIVDDPKPQTQTWCSGTRGFAVKPTQGCGDKNQVSVTTQPFSSSGSKPCRDYLTEVRTASGEIKTVTANSCQNSAKANFEKESLAIAQG
jgi:hypothetical protein